MSPFFHRERTRRFPTSKRAEGRRVSWLPLRKSCSLPREEPRAVGASMGVPARGESAFDVAVRPKGARVVAVECREKAAEDVDDGSGNELVELVGSNDLGGSMAT